MLVWEQLRSQTHTITLAGWQAFVLVTTVKILQTRASWPEICLQAWPLPSGPSQAPAVLHHPLFLPVPKALCIDGSRAQGYGQSPAQQPGGLKADHTTFPTPALPGMTFAKQDSSSLPELAGAGCGVVLCP